MEGSISPKPGCSSVWNHHPHGATEPPNITIDSELLAEFLWDMPLPEDPEVELAVDGTTSPDHNQEITFVPDIPSETEAVKSEQEPKPTSNSKRFMEVDEDAADDLARSITCKSTNYQTKWAVQTMKGINLRYFVFYK